MAEWLLAAATAAENGDTERVRECLFQGIDEEEGQRRKRVKKAVMWAAAHGRMPLLQCLCAMRDSHNRWLTTSRWLSDALCSAVDHQQRHAQAYLCWLPADRGIAPWAVARAVRRAAGNGRWTLVRWLCALPEERGVTAEALGDAVLAATGSAIRGIRPYNRILLHMCELVAGRGDAALVEAVARAAVTGSAAKLRFLCDRFAERDVMAMALCKAVSKAAAVGVLSSVQFLCELPAARGLTAEALTQAALKAACHGELPVLKYLCERPVERGVNPAANDNLALILASFGDHNHVVEYLLGLSTDRGVDAGAQSNCAITAAAQVGNCRTVAFLCRLPPTRGVNVAAEDNAALRVAAARGYADIVHCLSKLPTARGVDVAACNYEALRTAAEMGHLDVVKILGGWLGNGRDVDMAHNTKALRDAAVTATSAGHADVATYLRTLASAGTIASEPPSRAVKRRRRQKRQCTCC